MSEQAFRFNIGDDRDERLRRIEQLRQAVLGADAYDQGRAWHLVMNFIEDEIREHENTKRSSAGPGRQRRARTRSATVRQLHSRLAHHFGLDFDDEDDE